MLDIKMVRAKPDLVKQAMKTRNKDMDCLLYKSPRPRDSA